MELLTTISFQTDLLKIPYKDQKKFTKAVKVIQSDPFVGSGKAKKCFKHKFSNVYRYRIGQHRIIYCVGGKCIKLLTVGKRNDIYERFDADPDIDIAADIDLSGAQPIPIQTMHYDEPKIVDPVSGEDAYQPYPDKSVLIYNILGSDHVWF
jgi:mRNA-degrading endonuclease RelE of RelBE toxin-antitoxin system